ncbi:ArpU family phage packaging/lysis transcriptional regulator [Brevibacillus reuszeri]|uniref:ArpU family phage packaging/lysis transcriptional regulator n=1 Tax=Brevibacillus reuszeri TaxID=54915 RepID=UPI0028A1EA69|nr:ArpU family phage packaging/lysis transcriptional regulator [Brevibacillus reuszeri]
MHQISFLPELDRQLTQKAVEKAFSNYRLYKYLGFDEREAGITAGYELREGGRSNTTSDQTANIAVHNVDSKAAQKAYCERLERSVNRLPSKERFLITERYMGQDSEYITDYNIYCHKFDPPISENTYYKIRWKAFYKLALALDVQVAKNPQDERIT